MSVLFPKFSGANQLAPTHFVFIILLQDHCWTLSYSEDNSLAASLVSVLH